ncbi:hypothetical protein [Legionella quinlivanii]|nr:hypothetical protein [Legionella quinlivanii]
MPPVKLSDPQFTENDIVVTRQLLTNIPSDLPHYATALTLQGFMHEEKICISIKLFLNEKA